MYKHSLVDFLGFPGACTKKLDVYEFLASHPYADAVNYGFGWVLESAGKQSLIAQTREEVIFCEALHRARHLLAE